MDSFLQNPIIIWSIGLVVAVPLAVVVISEIIEKLRKAESPYTSAFEVLRNIFLPTLTASIIAVSVLKLGGENVWARLILTSLCFATAYTMLSFVGAIQSYNDASERWESRIPTIIKTVTRALAVLLPFGFLVAVVWNLDLTKYVAAIGVGSIAIAFALQNTLSSVISGILLALDKPFREGDWIQINGNTGRVIDLNWRTTRLEVDGRDVVVIPNTVLLDSELKNLTAIDAGYRDSISLGFAYKDLPNKVKEVALQVARDCPGVSRHPPAEVHTVSFDDSSIGYELHFHCDTFITAFQARRTRDELMTRMYYAAAREGLEIPFPIRTIRKTNEGDLLQADVVNMATESLRDNSVTGVGEIAVLDRLAAHARIVYFGKNTRVSEAGTYESGLYLIREGEAVIVDEQGHEIGRVGPGEFIGARLLVGHRINRFTTRASQDSEMLLFPIQAVNEAMGDDAKLARSLHNFADNVLHSLDAQKTAPTG